MFQCKCSYSISNSQAPGFLCAEGITGGPQVEIKLADESTVTTQRLSCIVKLVRVATMLTMSIQNACLTSSCQSLSGKVLQQFNLDHVDLRHVRACKNGTHFVCSGKVIPLSIKKPSSRSPPENRIIGMSVRLIARHWLDKS